MIPDFYGNISNNQTEISKEQIALMTPEEVVNLVMMEMENGNSEDENENPTAPVVEDKKPINPKYDYRDLEEQKLRPVNGETIEERRKRRKSENPIIHRERASEKEEMQRQRSPRITDNTETQTSWENSSRRHTIHGEAIPESAPLKQFAAPLRPRNVSEFVPSKAQKSSSATSPLSDTSTTSSTEENAEKSMSSSPERPRRSSRARSESVIPNKPHTDRVEKVQRESGAFKRKLSLEPSEIAQRIVKCARKEKPKNEWTDNLCTAEDNGKKLLSPSLAHIQLSSVKGAKNIGFRGSKIDWRRIPVIEVVDPDAKPDYIINDNIYVVNKYKHRVNPNCSEAIRALKFGEPWRKGERWPGIPWKKFTNEQMKKYGVGKVDWPIQAVFEDEDYEGYSFVYYEGWSCSYLYSIKTESFAETAPEMIKESKMMKRFLEAVKAEAMITAQEIVNEKKAAGEIITLEAALSTIFAPPRMIKNPACWFWVYQDLTYFHSMTQKDAGLAPIFYMSCSKNLQKPPNYGYTTYNVVTRRAFDRCVQNKTNWSYKYLSKNRIKGLNVKRPAGVCENDKDCKCHEVFNYLYGNRKGRSVKLLKVFEDSTIDVSDFRNEDFKVMMECSDACGCSSACPRRVIQRGQQHPLVVYHESTLKGFGVRAAHPIRSGELVCEYTGEMDLLPYGTVETADEQGFPVYPINLDEQEEERREMEKKGFPYVETDEDRALAKEIEDRKTKITSYEAGFNLIDTRIVICAYKTGNVARFINHSCEPNTAFIETHSRRSESDPLIPRIAIYAIKDIALGQEVTICYYDKTIKEKSSVKCQCKTATCMEYLPIVTL